MCLVHSDKANYSFLKINKNIRNQIWIIQGFEGILISNYKPFYFEPSNKTIWIFPKFSQCPVRILIWMYYKSYSQRQFWFPHILPDPLGAGQTSPLDKTIRCLAIVWLCFTLQPRQPTLSSCHGPQTRPLRLLFAPVMPSLPLVYIKLIS